MLFGDYTDHQKAKEFFQNRILERLDEIKKDQEWELPESTIERLDALICHIGGLRDSFGLFTQDNIEDLMKPVKEMLAMLASSEIKHGDIEGR